MKQNPVLTYVTAAGNTQTVTPPFFPFLEVNAWSFTKRASFTV